MKIDKIKSINKGYKRVWYILAVVWVAFATYYFGYKMYNDSEKDYAHNCKYMKGYYSEQKSELFASINVAAINNRTRINDYLYKEYSDVPLIKLYYCSANIINGYSYQFVELKPRYITIGRVLLIILPPFLLPFSYMIFLWIREGFDISQKE